MPGMGGGGGVFCGDQFGLGSDHLNTQFTSSSIDETSGIKLGFFDHLLPPLGQCLASRIVSFAETKKWTTSWHYAQTGLASIWSPEPAEEKKIGDWPNFQSLKLVRTKKPPKCFSVMLLLVKEYERESRSRERLKQSSHVKTAKDFWQLIYNGWTQENFCPNKRLHPFKHFVELLQNQNITSCFHVKVWKIPRNRFFQNK